MSGGTIFVWTCLVFIGLIIIVAAYGNRRLAKQREARLASISPKEREAFLENEEKLRAAKQKTDDEYSRAVKERLDQDARDHREQWNHGTLNTAMVCPHCTVKGKVRTQGITQKKGVSGGKATAALLTLGFSLLLTGLSRKERGTQAYCENCKNQWVF